MKILVSDKLSAECLRIFEGEGLELIYLPGASPQELSAAIVDVDALVVRAGTHVDEALLDVANRLRVIGRAGIGIENIDLAAANRKGVVVMNTPFGSATTSAEHTLAMLMAMARCIPQASNAVHSGRWQKESFVGVEITGKVLGVIGAGKIGRLVVERAVGLKMRVLVHDPYLGSDVVRQLGAEQVGFQEVIEQSDFITLHVPLNSETVNLLDEDAFSRVKPGCRIINCAQGGLIEETALAGAIRDGRVAGAALDVFAKEPPAQDNPLLSFEQVICTPHIRTSSVDAQLNVSVQIARQVVDFLQKGIVVNALNVPSISAELLGELKPFVTLAEKLGSFQAQLCPRGFRKLTIEYGGDVADHPTAPLTMALLKGLMAPVVGDTVNYINAPHLVRERGIKVVEVKSQSSEGFSNLIRLTVETSEGESSVAGAVFANGDYRLVRVNDYPLEAVPEGYILVLHNTDRPGVVAFIGQVLAEAQINIAMMNLSRRKADGQAVSLVTIDTPAPSAVLEKLRANANITFAVQVAL